MIYKIKYEIKGTMEIDTESKGDAKKQFDDAVKQIKNKSNPSMIINTFSK